MVVLLLPKIQKLEVLFFHYYYLIDFMKLQHVVIYNFRRQHRMFFVELQWSRSSPQKDFTKPLIKKIYSEYYIFKNKIK
jgi:hypothetical protein